MHSYQIDVDKRNKPLWVIAGLATAITAVLAEWLNTYGIHPTLQNFSSAPSAFFIFLILYWIFDRWLWQFAPSKWCFGISEPNLSGIWSGKLKSNTFNKEVGITLNIKQTWSKISVTISFDNSISCSFSAAIICSKSLPILIYNYDNTPHNRQSDSMTRHIGTAELVLQNSNILVGTYFNSGDRKTEGSITVNRQK